MQGQSSTVRNAALARWLANVFGALALALLAAGYALPVLHFTLVAHELCAEHGALHHVEEAPRAERGVAHAAPKGRAFSASAQAAHEHDHCGVVSTTAERSLLPSRVEVDALHASVTPAALGLRSGVAQPSLALLDYAPKLAPPV